MDGHWLAATVKRAFGCAAGVSEDGVHGLPRQSVASAGGCSVIPSHHVSRSGVSAVFVKIALPHRVFIAFGLVSLPVPGATPKKPASGLMAYRRPSGPNFIQQMSSPTVSTVQPGTVGTSIARFVFPQADGNAAATYLTSLLGAVSLRMSMCSASHPLSRAITEAMRRAKHFLPSRALPP
ncbi:unannotated protein [freshwater metagenome]|uniref:Unannotated protein n=1 Tax=freshwater metagenome TaxID=449393 RepID=A0A6J7CQ51_9ZZZZ